MKHDWKRRGAVWQCQHAACGLAIENRSSMPDVEILAGVDPCPSTWRGRLLRRARRLGRRLAARRTLATRYLAAALRWARAGFPMRGRAGIVRIWRQFCGSCPRRRGQRCALCGCRVSRNAGVLPLWNKLVWATEHCPIKLW